MDLHTIIDALQQAAPYVLAILLALTALAKAAQTAAQAFYRWALTTPTPKDDAVAEKLVRWADRAAYALDWLGTILPQLGFGQRQLPPTTRPPSSGGRPPRALVLTLMLAVAAAGCSGPPQAVRRGTTVIAETIVAVDTPAAEAYREAHERAMDASSTREEYDAAMRPWNVFEEALRGARGATMALDVALDAWGSGGESQWLGLAACLVISVRHLAEVATAVGWELPGELLGGLELVAPFAAGACPGRE